LKGEDPDPLRHQVTDLPELAARTTEYQRHRLSCEGCGHTTLGALPEGVPEGAFGPRLQAMLAYLSGQAHLSKRQIEELLEDAFGVTISLGSVVAAQQAVSDAVAAPVEEARAYVERQPVAHADETGWKEGNASPGCRKKAWLWVAVTRWVTVFLIHASRATVAARVLLGRFAGYLVTDRWNAYNDWPVRKRQICWAHLIRDFVGFVERGKRSARIGVALLREAQKMFSLWRRVRDRTLARSSFRVYLGPIRRRVERLLRRGTCCGEPKTEGMCVMILKLAPALWTFARIEGVEPTNNTAERTVRPAVLYRKGCFGTQSAAGSRFVERIFTVVATLRQQRRNVMDYLTLACVRAQAGKKAPSLLPSSARVAAAA
jgi:transposase